MKTLKDCFDVETLAWFQTNGLKYKLVNGKTDQRALILLYGEKYCLKLYDRMGHGFGVTVNVSDTYDESIYENDRFSLSWAFMYFNIQETAKFSSRKSGTYISQLPNLLDDIKAIVPRLNNLTAAEWTEMTEWMNKKAKEQFT